MSRASGAKWPERFLATLWLSALLVAPAPGSRLFPITTGGLVVPEQQQQQEQQQQEQQQQQQQQQMVGNASDSGSLASEEEVVPANKTMSCDDARMFCAYRTGCGRALQHYLARCASVLQGDVNECPEFCQHALIGLMSTDQGKELMTCECAKDDTLCRLSKQRAEICRASVTTTMSRARVSCRVATWICNADALCSTALQYYNDYCKRMFHGKKCTKRCRNSMNILRRQEKAAKLNTCFCDGDEEYDCNAIHRNMDELCFNKPSQHHGYREQPPGAGGDPRTNKIPNRAAAISSVSASWRILLLGLVLLLHSIAATE